MTLPDQASSITAAEKIQLRLLSENLLYSQALTFAADNRAIFSDREINHQLNGLLNASRSWPDLNNFVNNQVGRTWTGKKKGYGTFYNNFKQQMASLSALAVERFISEETLTKRQVRERTSIYAGLLAREFIQHLFAELVWQKEVGQ